MQSDGWKPATQKALSSPCYTSISLLKDNTFTRSSFDIFWLRLSKRIDSFLWQRPMDIESFCGREPNFQHGIVWLGLCKLKKIAQFEHLLWLLFPLTAFISQRAPSCLARLNHACAFLSQVTDRWCSKGNYGMLSLLCCANIGLLPFPTVENIFMLVCTRWSISAKKAASRLDNRNGKPFVPRFT